MDEELETNDPSIDKKTADELTPNDEGIDVETMPNNDILADKNQLSSGTIRTLDGEIAGDELEGDAINYQVLLGKIDGLLDRLKLDA